ncbi:MAG: hypothetical protein A3F83_00340 [Candidatus Glassbacteria bacterium RIFCSPLOWO2_12_FULL_58_11]|uniref:Transcriptional repressor n=1 Tax=Candidatus Glassbacteria bacterium RIFCSPLOWO2_12_FULL_58_11 TaxID=1817867 RepID=A0A1F5YP18_9BACT|nr:MAG: hypothetical protein A3F83_00340 [Candidatus Glassbacteria bacterium RIFCSPLOWO2_12_FULL_58_11]
MEKNAAEQDLRLEAFVRASRNAGIKLTHQRLEIFREIAASSEHPDVDTVFRKVRGRIPTLALDTVYRTFAVLEREKVLARVSLFSDKARFDPNTEPHHHFVCTKCGLVRDFYSGQTEDFRIPESVKSWGAVDAVYIELRGICRACGGNL